MIVTEFASASEIKIEKKEVLRYLGYGKNEETGSAGAVIDKCIRKIGSALACKACFDRFPVSAKTGEPLDIGFTDTNSKSLKKNLKGCFEIILFCATIGFEADRIIQKYSLVSPAYAVVSQAVGAAAIEKWCDELCGRFKKREALKKNFLRPRFSPGYGDFPLETQKRIFACLDCSRKIGVTLTDSLLMLPSKSVSAIIGVSKENTNCIQSGCEECENTECEFRRS